MTTRTAWTPLDIEQYRRIGPVHRGFLYQHFLAASIILACVEDPDLCRVVRLESDEDIEIETTTGYLYIQVKTTTDRLTFGEIETAVERFYRLAAVHEDGTRHGPATFSIVVAGPLGPELATNACHSAQGDLRKKLTDLAKEKRLDEARLLDLWAGIRWVQSGQGLPGLARVTVGAGVEALHNDLVRRLEQLPRVANSPSVAAMALAAYANSIAADALPTVTNRTLQSADCRTFVERIEVLLERLPELPVDFLPQSDFPFLLERGRSICVIGPSGSGKTTHLAWDAVQIAPNQVVYVRPRGSTPDACVADLIEQLGARLGELGAPGVVVIRAQSSALTGEERMRTLLDTIASDTRVLVDDAHLLPTDHPVVELFLRSLVGRNDTTLVLSAQPQRLDGTPAVSALLRATASPLAALNAPGWSIPELGRWFAVRGSPQPPSTLAEVRKHTGGYPAMVAAIASVASLRFNGEIERALSEVRGGTVESVQRAIIEASFDALPSIAQRLTSALAIIEFSPSAAELQRIVGPEAVSGLRRLTDHGVVRRSWRSDHGDPCVELQDVYRDVARVRAFEVLDIESRRNMHTEAAVLLAESFRSRGSDADRAIAFYINLLQAGNVAEATEYFTASPISVEALNRLGLGASLVQLSRRLLELATDREHRYWLRDALLFLYLSGKSIELDPGALWDQQREEVSRYPSPPRSVLDSFRIKQLLWKGRSGRLPDAERAWKELRRKMSDESSRRVLDYSWATILVHHKHYEQALHVVISVALSYCRALGLRNAFDLWAENLEDVKDALPQDYDDRLVVYLGDCFDLAGRCLIQLGEWPVGPLAMAGTLYQVVNAVEPMLKLRFEMCGLLLDDDRLAPEAVRLMKPTLEYVRSHGLHAYLLETLAWAAFAASRSGDRQFAEELLHELSGYDVADADELVIRARASLVESPRRMPDNVMFPAGPRTSAFMRKVCGF